MTVETSSTAAPAARTGSEEHWDFTYNVWLKSLDIPIHRGYFVYDLRKIELGEWKQAGRQSAAIILAGQEGIADARVTRIPPGATLPPLQIGYDEVIYVVEGRGATTIRDVDTDDQTSFEWHTNSMFMVPRNAVHELHNTSGEDPATLLHYSYLPLGLSVIPDPDVFINSGRPRAQEKRRRWDDFYEEARQFHDPSGNLWGGRTDAWVGSFFPDMSAWDKLRPNRRRGAGGRSVYIKFPGSELSCHMSVFAERMYKKAHRHGPGRVIVIPAGEGYSQMWEEGKEKIHVPWQQGSMFVPPNKYFHQHFNLGATPARYLALHPPMQFYGHAEKVEDRKKDQIEYANEDPQVRAYFEAELAKRGLASQIPQAAYEDPDYEWSYSEDEHGGTAASA